MRSTFEVEESEQRKTEEKIEYDKVLVTFSLIGPSEAQKPENWAKEKTALNKGVCIVCRDPNTAGFYSAIFHNHYCYTAAQVVLRPRERYVSQKLQSDASEQNLGGGCSTLQQIQ